MKKPLKQQFRTNLDNCQAFIRWVNVNYPQILENYLNSPFYKTMTKTNKLESLMKANAMLEDVRI